MTKNTDISERISNIIDYLGVNPNSFSKKLDYDRSQTIYDIINCKSAPSFDFFKRFMLSEYSENISIDWLLTGRGYMEYQKLDPVMASKLDHANCPICVSKDKLIERLEHQLERNEKEIDRLIAIVDSQAVVEKDKTKRHSA